MLVSKCKPKWKTKEVMLLRFVEENGADAVFRVTDGAISIFEQCELGRIYDLEVQGKCVHRVEALKLYGVNSNVAVDLQYHSKIGLSGAAWPLTFRYRPVDWLTLNQLDVDSVVDLVGVVLDKPVLDLQSTLSKLRVPMGNAGYQQDLYLLGEHANMTIKKGNVLALAGVRVREYRSQRSLQTSLLTLVEVNPVHREGLPAVEEHDEDSPRKKAMRLSNRNTMSVAEVMRLSERVLTAAQQSCSTSDQEFVIVGFLGKLTAAFFDDDAPIVGDDAKEKICWRTSLADASGTVDVRVWGRAAFDLFGLTATGLRERWDKGNDDPAETESILKDMNANLESQFECACNMSIWSWGIKEVKHRVDINVNAVDIKE